MNHFLNRIGCVAVAAILLATVWSPPAHAQAAPEGSGQSAAEQELAQQMQEVREQVMRNMIAQGVDIRAFFEEVRQASPDGNFDMDVLRQKLIDKGLLDQQTADHLQATMQKVTSGSLKLQMGLSDEEWASLRPKIQKVVDAAYAAGALPQQLTMMGFRPTSKTPSEVTKAMAALKATSKDDTAKPADVAEKLSTWRSARHTAQERYEAAQKELEEVLTRRQEAVLMLLGLLQ